MAFPWDISGDDIDIWAQRREAQALLPVLVRRLLLATTPLQRIEIRGHSGVNLGGWDGEVRSRVDTPWCSAGLSYWEFSVTADNAKLNGDFHKRLAVARRDATYVAVVGGRYTHRKGKRDWEDARRREGRWRDVRLLDADDLATWLEESPAASLWMAHELNKPVDGLVLPEQYLEEWRDHTVPPLPIDLLLLGESRQAAARELLAFANSPRAVGEIGIAGVPEDEARAFAVAAIAEDPALAERAVVVRSKHAWEWLRRASRPDNPLVLIPETHDAAPTSTRRDTLTVSPATGAARYDLRLRLDDYVPRDALQSRLTAFGMRADDAAALVRRTSARLTDLRRDLGAHALPDWARSQPQALWIPMLLMGRWTPGYEADRRVVQRMRADPRDLERMGEVLASLADRPLRRAEEHGEVTWEWCSPGVLWPLLSGRVSSADLSTFCEVAAEVLSTDDPRYNVPAPERFLHGVSDRRSRPSAPMREGIARTLALLGNPQAATGTRALEGRVHAAEVVRAVLTPSWKRWASCTNELSWLAEAAPNEFLRALESSLADRDGCGRLLCESEGAMGHTPHVGLLWALERLAWDSRWMPKCVDTLAFLAAIDPGGDINPRPASTLHNILAAIAPQTKASRDERLAALRRVVEGTPDTGWRLLLAILQESKGRYVWQGHRPEILQISGMPDPDHPEVDHVVIDEALKLAIATATNTPSRWRDLLDGSWNRECHEHLWAAFEQHEPSIRAGRSDLWHTMRSCRTTALHRGDTDHLGRIDRLAERLEPADNVERIAWLFGPSQFFSFSANWNDAQRLEDHARTQALQSLWGSSTRWEDLARLASLTQDPWPLGTHLATSPFRQDLVQHARAGTLAPALRKVQAPLLLRCIIDEGDAWGYELLHEFVVCGRETDATEILVRPALVPRWWRIAERLGGAVDEAYWSRVRVLGLFEMTDDDRAHAVERLLEHGRGVHILAVLPQPEARAVPPTAIARALEQVAANPDDPNLAEELLNPHFTWHVEAAFNELDQCGVLPDEDIAKLELRLLGLVLASRRSARALYNLLGERPAWFVDLLCMLYRSENDSESAQIDEVAQHRARAAFQILHEWRGFPGDAAEGAEREHRIEAWVTQVFDQSERVGRARVARMEVGSVLARISVAPGDDWPCVAARRLLEREPEDDLAHAIRIGRRNARGMTRRAMGEGGEQERVLASQYRASARRLRAEWPRTAAMLDDLADAYDHDAERQDASAQTTRERWAIDPAHGKKNPTMTEAPNEAPPRRRVERLLLHGMTFAEKSEVELGARMTLLVGDNSAGKSVVLDALWWALSGSWTRDANPIIPDPKANGTAMIGIRNDDGEERHARFDLKTGRWQRPGAWTGADALVVYARIDGGFSMYEPLREHALRLTADEVLDGLRDGGASICNGLIEDVPTWQARLRRLFDALNRALSTLSPPGEPLAFGDPVRASIHDAREIPTVTLPYGSIPVTHASAAVKRITSLAYVLLWAWREHEEHARLAQVPATRNVIVLLDEIESHLHPEWQRRVLPGVLEALGEVSLAASVQTIVVTHSPLVVSSVEQRFDHAQDRLIHLRLNGHTVSIEVLPFDKEGDVSAWLTSPAFGLRSTRSIDAERALARAQDLTAREDASVDDLRKANAELSRVLSPTDPYFVRWDRHLRRKGIDP